MAFFKFRKSGGEPSVAPVQPESVEAMRKRAKHRLIGAAVLLLAGVIGFPLLFDKQPRPIAVDTPIEIPDRNKVRPLNIPAPAAKQDDAPALAATPAVAPAATAPAVEAKPPAAPVAAASQAPKAMAKAEDKPMPAPAVKADEGTKAHALLDGQDTDQKPEASEARFVVQVGAFSDAKRAQEVRLKVEHAGLKTYTHVAQTKEGSRIRVRVGPYGSKAEADKAAAKIKRLNLPAAILSL